MLCVSRFHVCEMENFNNWEELNSIEPMGVVIVDVGHNKGAYYKWYKRKYKKKTHARRCNNC